MLLFVTVLHILLCLMLILIILLQPGKGSDIGAAFGGGGGASTLFGPRGPTNFLSQATTVVAVLFMFTSITLAIYSNTAVRSGTDISDEIERLQREKEEQKLRDMKDVWREGRPEEEPSESGAEAPPSQGALDLSPPEELEPSGESTPGADLDEPLDPVPASEGEPEAPQGTATDRPAPPSETSE